MIQGKEATLHLVLKRRWYDMIESGEKKEEYRACNPYWRRRLVRCFSPDDISCMSEHCTACSCCVLQDEKNYDEMLKKYDFVVFHRGYTDTTMRWSIKEITLDLGKVEWGAPALEPVFIIKLDNRIIR